MENNKIESNSNIISESPENVFGEKGNNLLYLKNNIRSWDKFIGEHNFPFHLEVPVFVNIPFSILDEFYYSNKDDGYGYILFKHENMGLSLEERLEPYIEEFKNKSSFGTLFNQNLIIRSSALYSEDGENITGAGIYESIVLRKNHEFDGEVYNLTYNILGEEFKNANFEFNRAFTIAVFSIFSSMFSKKAIEYRKRNNISQNEKMGLIIQEYLDYGSDGSFYGHCQTSRDGKGIGYFNSIVKGQPNKCKIVKNGIGYIMDRNNLIHDLDLILNNKGFENFKSESFNFSINEKFGAGKIFLTPLDDGNFNELSAYFASLYFLLLEREYGRFIQVEFAMNFGYLEKNSMFDVGGKKPFLDDDYSEKDMFNNQSNNILNLLQIRPLPSNYSEVKNIKFPKKEPIFVGKGIGVGKIKLKNLSKGNKLRGGDFSNKKGILVCDESEGYTNLGGNNNLPKSGGVIVVFPSNFWHGHLETIISERDDLLGVFNDGGKIDLYWKPEESKKKYEYYENIYNTLINADTIEIISNGLEARVYIS